MLLRQEHATCVTSLGTDSLRKQIFLRLRNTSTSMSDRGCVHGEQPERNDTSVTVQTPLRLGEPMEENIQGYIYIYIEGIVINVELDSTGIPPGDRGGRI